MSYMFPGYGAGSIPSLASVMTANFVGGRNFYSLNAAARRVGIWFTASVSESMTGFEIVVRENNGTITNGMTATMYAVDANGVKTGSALATYTGTPTVSFGNGVLAPVWASAYSVTAGQTYFIEIQNVLGSPGSNNFGFEFSRPGHFIDNLASTSTDSGATYSPLNSSGALFAPTYATSGVLRTMCVSTEVATDLGGGIYDDRKIAILINSPVPIKVYGFQFAFENKTGSPVYNLKGEICAGGSVVATSFNRIVAANTGRSVWGWVGFENGVSLAANVDNFLGYACENNTDGDSSNRVNIGANVGLRGNSRGLLKNLYLSTSGVNFSVISGTDRCPFFTMDFEVLASGGGGGGIFTQRGLGAGLN